MKKTIIVLILTISILFAGCSNNTNTSSNQVTQINNESYDDNNYVEITVKGVNFAFEPNEIVLKKGQKVRLRFESEQGYHDLVVDELNIATKKLREDERDEIYFTPNKVGEFEFYCSVGDHRAKGMVGTIRIIE